jgi:hypothetical protein
MAPKRKPFKDYDIDVLKQAWNYNPNTGMFSNTSGKKVGTTHCQGYIALTFKGIKFLAHRVAWAFMYGVWPSNTIDHINRNKIDNRILNLREASMNEQSGNTNLRSNNSSGVRGVYFNKKDQKWFARIKKNYKYYFLGSFDSKEDATAVYNKLHSRESVGRPARAGGRASSS